MNQPVDTASTEPKTVALQNTMAPALILLVAASLVHLWHVRIGLDNPPLDGHAFRQTQTALTAFWLQQGAPWFPPPLPLFGPPWSAPMEFPFYQAMVATVCHAFGLPLVLTGRVVALGCFYLGLPAIYLLGRHLGLARSHLPLLPAAMLLSPLYLFFGRSVTIETFALSAGLWFLWAWSRALERPTPLRLVITAALGAVAGLAKVTTLMVFLVPMAIMTWQIWRTTSNLSLPDRLRRFGPLGGAAAFALVITQVWIVYGNAVKNGNPLASFLTADQTGSWIFGKMAQRFSAEFWQQIGAITGSGIAGNTNLWLAVIIVLVGGASLRRKALILLGCYLTGPLLFANVYQVHDYYFMATGVFAVSILVLAWQFLIEAFATNRWGAWAAIAVSMALSVVGFHTTWFAIQNRPDLHPPPAAELIREITQPHESVIVLGQDWNPVIPFFAERRSIMPRERIGTDDHAVIAMVQGLKENPVAALAAIGPPDRVRGDETRLVDRLGLHPQPVVNAPSHRLYLFPDRIRSLETALSPPLQKVWTLAPLQAAYTPLVPQERLPVIEFEEFELSEVLDPVPTYTLASFGVSALVVEEQSAVGVHAPTDLVFDFASGVNAVDLRFGLIPAAYSDGNETDGVSFQVLVSPLDNAENVELIQEIMLRPSTNESDRGVQQAAVALNRADPVRVTLRADPGPRDDLSCDWVFWQKVQFRTSP